MCSGESCVITDIIVCSTRLITQIDAENTLFLRDYARRMIIKFMILKNYELQHRGRRID